MSTLEKIKADIKNQLFVGRILNSKDFDDGLKWCLELIGKYAEQEPKDTWSIKDVADTFKKHGLIREQEPCDFSFEIDYKTDVGRFVFSDGTEKRVNMGAVMDFSALKLAKKAYECGKAEALEQEPCDDVVSRQAVYEIIWGNWNTDFLRAEVDKLPSVRPQEPKWIPVTTRPMTEEEKERYREQLEYVDDAVIFNCHLPDDGQEVLITVYGETELDTFNNDAIDGCYFENRDIEDVRAWMPLPKPYKPQESEDKE